MKNIESNIKTALIFLFTIGMLSSLQAQETDQHTLDTKVAELRAQFPAMNASDLNKNMTAIADLGEEGIVKMISMLSSDDDNTQLEYAIGGFARYVVHKDREALQYMAANAFCEALSQLTAPTHQAFIIRQLQIAGTEESAICLQPYLQDDKLCGDAARAISSIDKEVGGALLTEALDKASGDCQLSIVEALGDMQYANAVQQILPFAKSSDQELQKVALYALSEIGLPEAASTMAEAAMNHSGSFSYINAFAAYEHYLRQLAKNGHRDEAIKATEKLFKAIDVNKLPNLKSAALKILVDLESKKKMKLLTKAAVSENASYRVAALSYAKDIFYPANTELWVKTINKADGEAQADIINMLAEANAETALPVILEFLGQSMGVVKIAAINAATKLGGSNVIDILLDIMANGTSAEIAAVKQALMISEGTSTIDKTAGKYADLQIEGKIAAIEFLSARGAESKFDLVYEALSSDDQRLSASAYDALPHVANEDHLQELYGLLSKTDNEATTSSVQSAIIAAVQSSGDPDKYTREVLDKMKNANATTQQKYFRILSALGGNEALQAVVNAYDRGDDIMKQKALDALSKWTNADALDKLFSICKQTESDKALDKALNGYIRLISKAAFPDAQKVLLLRRAMEVARTVDQKQKIIMESSNYKTFQSLVFAGEYLDDNSLDQAASWTVGNIALARPDFYGSTVRKLLNEALEKLQGNDSEYQKAAIRKHLAEMPEGKGFVPLFNGKDLSGWKGLVANPIKRAEMSNTELAKAQQKADETMKAGWKAEDGVLVFTGDGENICTEKVYGDFEMFVDWKIQSDGDAGIYLRGSPQVQIWDPARVDAGAQVGSGGLYNNKKHESKPLVKADNPVGEWNTFHIKMIDERVTVHLNGKLVVDNVIMENYWDRDQPIFSKGQIELQAHGTKVFYRDIYIKPIPK